jgi:transposase
MSIDEKIKFIIKDAARKLTGAERRAFQAKVAMEMLDGDARKAEREFGWGRETVKKGMRESETGIVCSDNHQGRGKKKTEERMPDSEKDIRDIAEPRSQTDPKFQSDLMYGRITAEAVRKALTNNKGYEDDELPTTRTILNIMNRLGYTLKKVRKSIPSKKTPEVDEIFANVREVNRESDKNPESLRISIDSKAEVRIGELSRGGKSRKKEAEKAHDHDTKWDAKLKPVGISDVVAGFLMIVFANSPETSDLIADSITMWWERNRESYYHIKELVINLDNGPHNSSHRTQFIKRMVELSDKTGLRIRLVYYPPYHSKYNPVERCRGVLERHRNGTILNSIEKTINRAETMTWKGIRPVVDFIDKIYEKGVVLTKKEMKKYDERLDRSIESPKYDVRIEPQSG